MHKRYTERHCGKAVIKDNALLPEALEKLARIEEIEESVEQHSGFVRCGDCEYFMKEYGCNWCRLTSGLDGDLKDTDGCTKGKTRK